MAVICACTHPVFIAQHISKNCISELVDFKIVLGAMPPHPLDVISVNPLFKQILPGSVLASRLEKDGELRSKCSLFDRLKVL